MEKTNSIKRIILTGPESTGKTALALQLAEEFSGLFIEEYARIYIERLKRQYNYEDLIDIAEYQKQTYHRHRSEDPVFFDTYLIITKIWFNWVFSKFPTWIDREIQSTKNDLYLLCSPDIPWIPDALRENGGENRKKLFDLYQEELVKNDLHYQIVEGIGNDRYQSARAFVEDYLSTFDL